MASISREPNGRRTIQFVSADGSRKSIRLGKVSQRTAEAVKVRVEQLASAVLTSHVVDDETARWVAGLDGAIHGKLATVGLVPDREHTTLGDFIDGYIRKRGDVKPGTATMYGHTRRCLVSFFGAERSLRAIAPGDADDWRLWLINHEKLAAATVRRRCGIAKQFCKAAMRKGLIASNPFADLVSAVRENTERAYFITREETAMVLDACPDAEWRLIFALSRFGGLRCPSEHLSLCWSDVDWAKNRIIVRSPKTEHHAGGNHARFRCFPNCCHTFVRCSRKRSPAPSTSSRDTARQVRTCGRKCTGSSSGRDWSLGRARSRTCVPRARLSWLKAGHCMSSPSGSATRSPSPRSTTYN